MVMCFLAKEDHASSILAARSIEEMMKDSLVTVEKIMIGSDTLGAEYQYHKPITVTLTMSELVIDDFNSAYPLDTAQQFGEALLQELSLLLKK